MVVCFWGARIRRDLFKSLEVFFWFLFFFHLSAVKCWIGYISTQFLKKVTCLHKPKRWKKSLLKDVKYILWDVLIGDINVRLKAVYPSTDLTLIKVLFATGGSLQMMHINLSWCAHLRSFSMWCLGMPDSMAWSLYHSKVWSQGTCWDLNWDLVHLVVNVDSFQGDSSWEMGSLQFSLVWKGSKRTGSTAEPPMMDRLVTRGVNRGQECVWTRGDGVLGSSLQFRCSGGQWSNNELKNTQCCVRVCVWSNPCCLIQTYTHHPLYICHTGQVLQL